MRARVTIAFALGALLVTSVLAAATYLLSERYLLEQRERNAGRQTYLDARLIRDALAADDTVDEALERLELATSQAAVRHRGRWFGSGVAAGRDALPAGLRATVIGGQPAHQRAEILGEPRLVVGVPLPAADATYFEVFSLHELEETLGVIRNTLIGAALATTAGGAIVGVWAGRRVLRPVRNLGSAAARIAGGDLAARVERTGDADLDAVTESFNEMATALEARIERDARFASDVSHELRSPLTTLATTAEILENRREELSDRLRGTVDLLIGEIRHFQAMVEELLELSRAESGADPVLLEPVSLPELVFHAASRLQGTPFVVDLDPSITGRLMLDKRRIDRVLTNLIANARSHGGGLRAIRAYRHDGVLRLEVEDEGPGIAPEHRQQVFERFFRGAKAGSRGDDHGSGLGLALVAEHVRVLGGSVRVVDPPEAVGTQIRVELPWRPA
jgi:signal transduction histidine kinase